MRKKKKLNEGIIAFESKSVKGNIIEGVKILGTKSKNGRYYPISLMEKCAHLYEGKVVNLDHKMNGTRSVLDRFGFVKNIRVKEDGMYGDLEYNPEHPYAKAFKYFAENKPDCIGLSHAAVAHTKMDNKTGTEIVENIIEVESVDLVGTAATNKSLFESYEENIKTEISMSNEKDLNEQKEVENTEVIDVSVVLEDFVSKDCNSLESFHNDFKSVLASVCSNDEEKIAKLEESFVQKHNKLIEEVIKSVKEKVAEKQVEPEDDTQKKLLAEEYLRKSDSIGHKLLLEELDRYRLKDQTEKKMKSVTDFCEKSGLDKKLVTESFVDVLMNVPEDKWVKLVEDRKSISSFKSPISFGSDVTSKSSVLSVDELVKKLIG